MFNHHYVLYRDQSVKHSAGDPKHMGTTLAQGIDVAGRKFDGEVGCSTLGTACISYKSNLSSLKFNSIDEFSCTDRILVDVDDTLTKIFTHYCQECRACGRVIDLVLK